MSGLHRDINLCANFPRSRRFQKQHERAGGRAGPQAGRPPYPLGTRPSLVANHDESRGLCSTAFEEQGEPFNQGRFDPTAQIHLRGLYKQGPWPLEKQNPHYSLAYFPERIQREWFLRVPSHLIGLSIRCKSRISSTRLREIEWRCRSEEAQPVGVYSEVVPVGSSLLT